MNMLQKDLRSVIVVVLLDFSFEFIVFRMDMPEYKNSLKQEFHRRHFDLIELKNSIGASMSEALRINSFIIVISH